MQVRPRRAARLETVGRAGCRFHDDSSLAVGEKIRPRGEVAESDRETPPWLPPWPYIGHREQRPGPGPARPANIRQIKPALREPSASRLPTLLKLLPHTQWASSAVYDFFFLISPVHCFVDYGVRRHPPTRLATRINMSCIKRRPLPPRGKGPESCEHSPLLDNPVSRRCWSIVTHEAKHGTPRRASDFFSSTSRHCLDVVQTPLA